MKVKADDRRKSLDNKQLTRESLPEELEDFLIELKAAEEVEERQKAANKILKLLNKEFGLPNCRLRIYDDKRPTVRGRKPKNVSRDQKFWYRGLYNYEPKKSSLIEIWNMQPCEVIIDGEIYKAERNLSWQHILNVLLHEFVHHHDVKGLKIEVDHDSGFWSRFKNIRRLVFSHVNVVR
jgi:hypothetical protein